MFLYKYRGVSQLAHTLDILVNKRLHCAPYEELNDPFEGQFISVSHGLIARDPELVEAEITELPPSKKMMAITGKSLPRICSLSESAVDVMLWSLYADSHKGVVIEINFTGIEKLAHPVVYSKTLRHFRSVWGGAHPQPEPVEILTQKTDHWSYEKERRVLHSEQYLDVTNRISRVLLGPRISELHRSLILAACQDRFLIVQTELDHQSRTVKVCHPDSDVEF